MDQQFPVFTLNNECQDCYKCVRHCPVKAIKVFDHRASIVPELCTSCGQCVLVCPVQAKKVRNDISRVKSLFQRRRKVFASLAPSWVAEFSEESQQMISALHQLGFAGVSETALGAQQVSLLTKSLISQETQGLFISSACPVAIDFLRKMLPEMSKAIMQIKSPAMIHAEMLKQFYGSDIGVVLISPCIAKKHEAENSAIDVALTFKELRDWLREENLNLEDQIPSPLDEFVPYKSEEGRLYPIEGGMIETLRQQGLSQDIRYLSISGIPALERAFAKFDPTELHERVFVEVLACAGGCINGPTVRRDQSGLAGHLRVQKNTVLPKSMAMRNDKMPLDYAMPCLPCEMPPKSPEYQIKEALENIGKFTLKDELNCSGCGYESCRHFAQALVDGRAEVSMCVSYMRKLAQKKANALLRTMPSGVVIVGADMRIIECNRRLVEFFGEEGLLAYDARPGLVEVQLKKVIPFVDLFETAMNTSSDICRNSMRVGDRLLNIVIFSIEKNKTIGAVITDVTNLEHRREQIQQRAREVIEKNLATVQEIACMLGEHMADTEILLRDIATAQ